MSSQAGVPRDKKNYFRLSSVEEKVGKPCYRQMLRRILIGLYVHHPGVK